MASLTHLAAGAVCGAAYAKKSETEPAHAIAAFAFLALAPDLDFFFAFMGAGGTPLDHRGITHALPFAVAAGIGIAATVSDGRHRRWAAIFAIFALASHGLLDALTISSPPPQLLLPFSGEPIELPGQFIPGNEGWQDYFSVRGLPVLRFEAIVSLPALLWSLWLVRDVRSADRPARRRSWSRRSREVVESS